MPFEIAFYVHHHGAGHFMRTLQLIKLLPNQQITLIGSDLRRFSHLLPDSINVLHLPIDIPDEQDNWYVPDASVPAFHYAPLNVHGITDRAAMMSDFFKQHRKLILIVDVSVEVALFARLCGIPTIIVKQHGRRDDTAHTLAYESAEALLAPYAERLETESRSWVVKKTIFTGGFSRYPKQIYPIQHHKIVVLIGAGGTSIDEKWLCFFAANLPMWSIHVLGLTATDSCLLDNLHFYGHQEEPLTFLADAEIVVGNTGHNTVMEVASLNKRLIGIPEDRPFDEQLDKALAISKVEGVKVVKPMQLYEVDWSELLNVLLLQEPNWHGIVSDQAAEQAAEAIISIGDQIFGNQVR